MKILVIGGGGREHALAWKAAQSPKADRVFVAPGNAGTEREAGVGNVNIGADDIERLTRAGAKAFLVGESLMREDDVERALRKLRRSE